MATGKGEEADTAGERDGVMAVGEEDDDGDGVAAGGVMAGRARRRRWRRPAHSPMAISGQ